jgi:hypothetical protein
MGHVEVPSEEIRSGESTVYMQSADRVAVPEDIQLQVDEADMLWKAQGYGTTTTSMLQESAGMDDMFDTMMTALAQNVKGLLDTTGEQGESLRQVTERVESNSAAIEALKLGGGGGDSSINLQDIYAQLNELLAFKAEASMKLTTLETTLEQERSANELLRQAQAQLEQDALGARLGAGPVPGSGGGGVDLMRIDDELNELRWKLQEEQEKNLEQESRIDHALSQIAAQDATDDVLDAIDIDALIEAAEAQVRKTPSWPRSWANFSLF